MSDTGPKTTGPTTYACLLRAVNVSGHRRMKMAQLRDLCASMGLSGVRTYLQSGNVVVESTLEATELSLLLEGAIREELGYPDVTVLTRTAEELRSVLVGNPFVERGCNPTKLHATLLSSTPTPERAASMDHEAHLPDGFELRDRVVYVHCPGGNGRTRLNNSFFERKLGVRATSRNWKTMHKLLELIEDA
jgi:uncharacterized protein (DUF1697 family)